VWPRRCDPLLRPSAPRRRESGNRLRALIASCLIWSSAAQAADIYQWVDENGRTQISDFVPEKYRKSATKIDSRRFELTADQKAQVQSRLALEAQKAAAADADRRKAQSDAVSASRPASGPASVQTSPRPVVKVDADCDTLRKLFRESQECFAPYVNTNGSVKAEAYERCTSLPDPAFKCGVATSR
jgi:hypothetical protein